MQKLIVRSFNGDYYVNYKIKIKMIKKYVTPK